MVSIMKKRLKNDLKNTQDKTTIKVSNSLRDKLAEIGNKDETFEDVIWRLIRRAEPERSGEVVTSKSSVIQYKREKDFIEVSVWIQSLKKYEKVGIEYEYNNPPKRGGDWELDIKIIKLYYNQKVYNPSEFFGVDNEHKHLSEEFICAYFSILADIFIKNFGITKLKKFSDEEKISIVAWRKIYYENKISEESFINDVEDVLRNFSDSQSNNKVKEQLKNSIIGY